MSKTSNRSLQRLLTRLAKLLKGIDAPYMVIGGQAVLRHGEPRITRDVDLTLGVSPFDAEPVIQALVDDKISPLVQDPKEFIRRTHLLPCQTQGTFLRLDLSFTDSPYELQAIARGEDVTLAGTPVRFATAEDLVIHKIIAGRPIDHQDVMGVLLKNPNLDADYVRHWLGQFAQALERPLIEEFERMWELSKK